VELTYRKPRTELEAIAGWYSPDGRWIVFRFGNFDTGRLRIMKMHADGADKTLIARLRHEGAGRRLGAPAPVEDSRTEADHDQRPSFFPAL
jgi:Tol biopolymer transport system component